MKELISVIVPIYNVDEYLPKCLESLINQTYRNLEIILVDDGSSDNCPKICDQYAKRDTRIKVIHQKNSGVSAARNKGLDMAKGEYIAFVDPDDYIHSKLYEKLYENMEKYKADLSVCDIFLVEGTKQPIDTMNRKEQIKVFSGREALVNLFNELAVVTVSPVNKLYRRELFVNLRYEIGKGHEDEFIIHQILDRAKRVIYSDLPMYFYYQRSNSAMHQYSLKRLHVIEAKEKRIEFLFSRRYRDLYEPAYKEYLNVLFLNYFKVKRHFPKEEVKLKELHLKFLETYKNVHKYEFSIITRLKYNIFLFSPVLCERIINLKSSLR